MIAADDPQEYVPYGRGCYQQHPHAEELSTSSATSFGHNVTSSPSHCHEEHWHVSGRRVPAHRPHNQPTADTAAGRTAEQWSDEEERAEEREEEIYWRGSVLVASGACYSNSDSVSGTDRPAHKSFSLDRPVLAALRCDYTWTASGHVLNEPAGATGTGSGSGGGVTSRQAGAGGGVWRSMSALVCVSGGDTVMSWTDDGEQYATPLPFQVSDIWRMQEGLLLRRTINSNNNNSNSNRQDHLPLLFSLLHPLDDTAPVITRCGNGEAGLMSCPDVSLVFVSARPSLAVTFDRATGQHTVWHVRRTTAEEWWLTGIPAAAAVDTTAAGGLHHSVSMARHQMSLSLDTADPLRQVSHATTKCAGVGGAVRSRNNSSCRQHNTSVPTNSMHHNTTTSRSHLSLSVSCYMRLAASPSPARAALVSTTGCSLQHSTTSAAGAGPTHNSALPACTGASRNISAFTGGASVSCVQMDEAGVGEPPHPDVCFQRVHTDSAVFSEPASRGFVTRDVFGSSYVVLLTRTRADRRGTGFLRMLQCRRDANTCATYVCTAHPHTLPASDALPIPNCRTMLVCDASGVLTLYTGVYRLCRVHVPSLIIHPPTTSLVVPTASMSVHDDVADVTSCLEGSGIGEDVSFSASPFCPLRRSSLLPARATAAGNPGGNPAGNPGGNPAGKTLSSCQDGQLSQCMPSPVQVSDHTTTSDNVICSHEHDNRPSTKRMDSISPNHDVVDSETFRPGAGGISLKCVVGNSVIMRISNGNEADSSYLRFSLPSPLDGGSDVTRSSNDVTPAGVCVLAVCRVLALMTSSVKRDVIVSLLSRWLCSQHAPGVSVGSVGQQLKMLCTILLQMMGFAVDNSSIGAYFGATQQSVDSQHSAGKRACVGDNCGDQDWQFLLSHESANFGDDVDSGAANLTAAKDATSSSSVDRRVHIDGATLDRPHKISCGRDTSAILYEHTAAVLFALHLVYEDWKLNVLYGDLVSIVAHLVHFLAHRLNWRSYVAHYCRDRPHLSLSVDSLASCTCFTCNDDQQADDDDVMTKFPASPPDVMTCVQVTAADHVTITSYPHLAGVNDLSAHMISVFDILSSRAPTASSVAARTCPAAVYILSDQDHIGADGGGCLRAAINAVFERSCPTLSHTAVWLLVELGYTRGQLQLLPAAFCVRLVGALLAVRACPPASCVATSALYMLVGRHECDDFSPDGDTDHLPADEPQPTESGHANTDECGLDIYDSGGGGDGNCGSDGAWLERLLWPLDCRCDEVRRQLASHRPVLLSPLSSSSSSAAAGDTAAAAAALAPDPADPLDHQYLEQQRRRLLDVCQRTMALGVGRGMLQLHSAAAVVAETLPVRRLCVSGRMPPRGASVELTDGELPAAALVWPHFHGGVAAALAVPPDALHVDASWILNNRPKEADETALVSHAGVLLALGLNGHLWRLAKPNVHDYLVLGHDITSLGLLLGLAACKRGTMHLDTLKLLSIHVESLLPPTSRELDIPHNVQVAAVLGVGLVYEASNNRHMSEVLLREIVRPPPPPPEAVGSGGAATNDAATGGATNRESYALAAGLALGMVTLGSGARDPHGLLPQLYRLVFGGRKNVDTMSGNSWSSTGLHETGCNIAATSSLSLTAASQQIDEGGMINTDVTAAGATLALALMNLDSLNESVARWLEVPHTMQLLEHVRPDLLQLRVLARCLVLWRRISPCQRWLDSHLPSFVRSRVKTSAATVLEHPDGPASSPANYGDMSDIIHSVYSGACLAVGLRYAGTADPSARQFLLSFVHRMIDGAISRRSSQLTVAADNALCVVVSALAMVMAGSGDLEVLRVCRLLRARVTSSSLTQPANYGFHMVVHMSLGLLFLAGGRRTLSNRPSSVAALLAAFYPRYPASSGDNRYHLQAFRHLYVLATEPRLLTPRDVDTRQPVYCHLSVTLSTSDCLDDRTEGAAVTRIMRAPCLLPRLDTITRLSVVDELFWSITIENTDNKLRQMLSEGGYLSVKQKCGASLRRRHLRAFLACKLNDARQISLAPQPPEATESSTDSEDNGATVWRLLWRYLSFSPRDGAAIDSGSDRRILSLLNGCMGTEKLQLFLPLLAAGYATDKETDEAATLSRKSQMPIVREKDSKCSMSSDKHIFDSLEIFYAHLSADAGETGHRSDPVERIETALRQACLVHSSSDSAADAEGSQPSSLPDYVATCLPSYLQPAEFVM